MRPLCRHPRHAAPAFVHPSRLVRPMSAKCLVFVFFSSGTDGRCRTPPDGQSAPVCSTWGSNGSEIFRPASPCDASLSASGYRTSGVSARAGTPRPHARITRACFFCFPLYFFSCSSLAPLLGVVRSSMHIVNKKTPPIHPVSSPGCRCCISLSGSAARSGEAHRSVGSFGSHPSIYDASVAVRRR